MSDHIITLTAAEEILLSFLQDRINAHRAQQEEDNSPLTADQILAYFARNDLGNIRTELNGSTQELWQIQKNLTSAQRTALLAQLTDGPRKLWLQLRIQLNQ